MAIVMATPNDKRHIHFNPKHLQLFLTFKNHLVTARKTLGNHLTEYTLQFGTTTQEISLV